MGCCTLDSRVIVIYHDSLPTYPRVLYAVEEHDDMMKLRLVTALKSIHESFSGDIKHFSFKELRKFGFRVKNYNDFIL